MKKIITLLTFILAAGHVQGQTIAQKKAGLSGSVGDLNPEMQKFLNDVNNELRERHEELVKLQRQVLELYLQKAPEESYHELLLHINDIKENIRILEESWREMVTRPGVREEGYALWHQPETTLEQIVLDYGASEYVYLIPVEIGSIQVSLNSNIPIPRAAWSQMLEQILLQNGVGIKAVNPYLRELYQLKEDFSDLRLITNDPRDLEAFPSNARVSFILTPSPEDVRRIWFFLEKFINPNATVLQRFGRVILIVGEVSAIKDLLKVYDFIAAHKQDLEYKAVPLSRVDPEEMAKILTSIFQEFDQDVEIEVTSEPLKGPSNGKAPPFKPNSAMKPQMKPISGSGQKQNQRASNSLSVTALPKMAQAVFLVGTREEIDKAVNIIKEIESQVGAARDKEIFWYKVKHSDPEELGELLQKIYQIMIENRIAYEKPRPEGFPQIEKETIVRESTTNVQRETTAVIPTPFFPGVTPYYPQDNFYQQGGYVINPRPAEPGSTQPKEYNKNRDNFLVDPKTSSLVMVVEVDLYPKLLELLKKIDVPKKQVQIECLLFERRNRKQNNYGLNLLRVGSSASQTHVSALNWNDIGTFAAPRPGNLGILELLLSRPKSETGIPSFDISYKFLMSQDDVHINASPSVVTLNQVPASIVINEEISINTGVYQVPTQGGTTLQDSFTRAQYGINITVTPTIHVVNEEEFFANPENYVHLVTDITFDTFAPSVNQQPDVTRRHITNEVNIPDGQTVVIGGLRRENTRDRSDKIPFLGEIPGLGKLFSFNELSDDDTEMFIFITPKIVYDQIEDFERLRMIDLCKRPGDLPSFLASLNDALECEKRRLMQGSLTMLFGLPHPRYIDEEGEYDGRCR